MLYINKTRFKKTEDALRFYFRLRELLHSGRARRLVADELPAHSVHGDAVVGLAHASDELDDLDAGMIRGGMVQCESTIFAPAPKKGGFPGCVHHRYR